MTEKCVWGVMFTTPSPNKQLLTSAAQANKEHFATTVTWYTVFTTLRPQTRGKSDSVIHKPIPKQTKIPHHKKSTLGILRFGRSQSILQFDKVEQTRWSLTLKKVFLVVEALAGVYGTGLYK